MLLDLRPITPPYYPREFTCCRYDPTALITTLEDAQAAAEDVTVPLRWPHQVSTEASWATAALWCGSTLFEARVRGILNMVDKQRDPVKMTVSKALTAWLRTSIRDRDLPTFDPSFLDEGGTTLYVLSPSDGTVAPLSVTLMEQLIRRQHVKVAQCEEYPRIGMFLDELPNTPLPKILQYFAEARGLGVSICAAAQASSQLDVVYGALQGRAIRDVVPATCSCTARTRKS